MVSLSNFMNWKDPKKALITGASSGIGAEYARQLAAQGFQPILTARRKNKLEEVSVEIQEKYSIEPEIIVADLSILSDIEKIRKRVESLDDQLDILINNAGFDLWKSFSKTPLQRHIDMLNVHNNTPVQLCYTATPGMVKKNRGVIINVSSRASFMVWEQQHIMYTSTKAFLTVFSEMLQMKLKRKRTDIRVQALCPGWTTTDMHDTEEMKGFKRNNFTGWMDVENVIKESLDAFKTDIVTFVPGDHYRAQEEAARILAGQTDNILVYRYFGD